MTKRDSVVASAAGALRALIAERYAVGDQLPNEKQLAELLDVSRGSIREALGQLAAEGAVTRSWGVGTFVSAPRTTSSLSMSAIRAYRDRVRDADRDINLLDAGFRHVKAPAHIAAALGLRPGQVVWRVHRLFAVDGVPSAYMIEHIPTALQAVAIDPAPMMSLETGLFDMLNGHVAGVVAHTSTEIEAVALDADDALLLEVAPGVPVLRTEQVTTDAQGGVLAYGVTLQRTDVLRMRITR